MTDRPPDERGKPYSRDQRPADPVMEDWRRLHDAMCHLGREIIAPVRPLIIRVLDGLMVVLNGRERR
jgi:hypothetical protein